MSSLAWLSLSSNTQNNDKIQELFIQMCLGSPLSDLLLTVSNYKHIKSLYDDKTLKPFLGSLLTCW